MPGLERETGMMHTCENKLYLMVTIKQPFFSETFKKHGFFWHTFHTIHTKDIPYSTSHNRALTYQAGINTIIGISITNFFFLAKNTWGKY